MLNAEEMVTIKEDILPVAFGGNSRLNALALLGDKLLDVLFYER